MALHLADRGVDCVITYRERADAAEFVVAELRDKGRKAAALRLDVAQAGGRILNVSTGLTRISMPGYSAYAMMKSGLEVLTRYLARELATRQITVNSLAPGAIEVSGGMQL